MFRTFMCPSSGGNYCIYRTLVFVTLYGWRLVCWLEWNAVSLQPADQTPPKQSDKYQCRTNTVIYSWWWAHGCSKHVQKWNKYINQNCAPSRTYLQDSQKFRKQSCKSVLSQYKSHCFISFWESSNSELKANNPVSCWQYMCCACEARFTPLVVF